MGERSPFQLLTFLHNFCGSDDGPLNIVDKTYDAAETVFGEVVLDALGDDILKIIIIAIVVFVIVVALIVILIVALIHRKKKRQ